MKKYAAFFFLSTWFLFSCIPQTPMIESEQQEQNHYEYIIFGHFYGHCKGESCIEIYKLTDDALYEDTNDFYPTGTKKYEGAFVKVDTFKSKELNDLNVQIPEQLLQETSTVLGIPDGADGGGIYLELPNGQYWLLDMNTNYLPPYLHPLQKQIVEAIAKINA